jgi:hypothetical protein
MTKKKWREAEALDGSYTTQSASAVEPRRATPLAASGIETTDDYKTCPDCAEEVRAAANVCRFCGYRFD